MIKKSYFYKLLKILFLCVFLTNTNLLGFDLNDHFTSEKLKKHSTFYYEENKNLSFEDIQKKEFVTIPPPGGIYSFPVWSKLDFKNNSIYDDYVIFYEIIIGKLTIWVQDENGIQKYESGLFSPDSTSILGNSTPSIPIKLGHRGIIFLKYDYDDPINFNTSIFSQKNFSLYTKNINLIYGLYLGLIFCILFTSLVLFLVHFEIIYLNYILSVIFTCSGFLMIYGYITEYVISAENFRKFNIANILGIAMVISNLSLFINFIIPKKPKRFFWWLSTIFLSFASVLFIHLIFFPTTSIVSWCVNISILGSEILIFIGSLFFARKNFGTFLFLLGWISMLCAIFIMTLSIQGAIDSGIHIQIIILLASFLEGLLIFLAIKTKIEKEKKINEKASVSLQALTKGIANIAHDFRSPFYQVNALLSIINKKIDPKYDIYKKQISQSIDYIDVVCQDFLYL